MDIQDRIAQWEKMTREAPDDMAWFSLGNAYKEADRLAEAESALAKAIGLNPNMSRAYQLRGQVLMQLDRRDEAADLLAQGYRVAAERGDVMPQRAIGSLLQQLGRPLPQVAKAAGPAVAVSGDSVTDRRTGQPGTRMADPPMRGPLGQYIRDHYSQETWQEWIRQGTKVINELRLDFSQEEHQRVYEHQMKDWLQISDEDLRTYAQRGGGG